MFCKRWFYHLQFSKDFFNTQIFYFYCGRKLWYETVKLESPEKDDREFLLDWRVTAPSRKEPRSSKKGGLKLLEIQQENAEISAKKEMLYSSPSRTIYHTP